VRDRLTAIAGWSAPVIAFSLGFTNAFVTPVSGLWMALLAVLPIVFWGYVAKARGAEWCLPAMGGLGLCLPLTILFITLTSFSLVDSWPWIMAGAGLAGGIAAGAGLAFRNVTRPYGAEPRPLERQWMLFVMPVAVIYLAMVLVEVNAADTIRPVETLQGRVVERIASRGKSAPRLILAGGPAALGIDEVEVARGRFDRSPVGGMVCVRIYTGLLGLRWYEVADC
jgi:hypothetical protein